MHADRLVFQHRCIFEKVVKTNGRLSLNSDEYTGISDERYA